MPRSNRSRRGGRPRGPGSAAAPGPRAGAMPAGTASVLYAGQLWSVRQVRGADSGRELRCPGCQQQIAAGTPHTVVWPQDAMQGLDNRRHWHVTCWAARDRRRPGGSFA